MGGPRRPCARPGDTLTVTERQQKQTQTQNAAQLHKVPHHLPGLPLSPAVPSGPRWGDTEDWAQGPGVTVSRGREGSKVRKPSAVGKQGLGRPGPQTVDAQRRGNCHPELGGTRGLGTRDCSTGSCWLLPGMRGPREKWYPGRAQAGSGAPRAQSCRRDTACTSVKHAGQADRALWVVSRGLGSAPRSCALSSFSRGQPRDPGAGPPEEAQP